MACTRTVRSTLQSDIGIHYLPAVVTSSHSSDEVMLIVGRLLREYSPKASQVVHEAGAYLWFHEATASNSPFPWIRCWSIAGLPLSASAFLFSLFIDAPGWSDTHEHNTLLNLLKSYALTMKPPLLLNKI